MRNADARVMSIAHTDTFRITDKIEASSRKIQGFTIGQVEIHYLL